MLRRACHLFCMAGGDLGSLKVCAPSVSQEDKKEIISLKVTYSRANLSFDGAGRSKPTLIGSHNTFSCFLPLLPSCDILYLSLRSLNIFPIWSSPSFSRCSLSLSSSAFVFYSHTCAHTHPGTASTLLIGQSENPGAFRLASVKYMRICY